MAKYRNHIFAWLLRSVDWNRRFISVGDRSGRTGKSIYL